MPTMKTGTRGGPKDPDALRNIGNPKQPTVRFGEHAHFAHNGVEVEPEIVYAMARIIAVFFKKGLSVIWTSIVRNEDRLRFSLHPYGYGVDVDTDRELPHETWSEIGDDVVRELGPEYDVIVHDVGSGIHLHVEWDPEDNHEWTQFKIQMKEEWEDRHASKA